MKSFKDFVLNEEANEELIKALEELEYNEKTAYDWPEGLSDKGIDALESASSVEEFNTRKKEIIESLRSNKEGDSSSEEIKAPEQKTKAEKSIEDDIEGLKEYFENNISAGNIDNIFNYLTDRRKVPSGNASGEIVFEKTIKSLNATINSSEAAKADIAIAKKAKNALIFYILFKALIIKASKASGGANLRLYGTTTRSKDLLKAAEYIGNNDIKTFLHTADELCKKVKNFLGNGNTQLNNIIEKYSETDIDDNGLAQLEKEVDNYKHTPSDNVASSGAASSGAAPSSSGNPPEPPKDDTSNGATPSNPGNPPEPPKNSEEGKSSEEGKNSEEAKEIKLTGINAINKNTSQEEFFKIHQEIYGDESGDDLGSYYKQYEKQARNYQDKNDKLYHSSDFNNKDAKEELNNLKESSNVVMDIINNDAYKNIISENIFRGRLNTSKEHTETGRFGWGECLKDFKQIRNKAFTKAQGLFNSIFKENTGVNEKINLIQKYKEVAFKYRRDLEKTLYKFLEHNSYNELGKMGHDLRISARKGFEKTKEILANSKGSKMLEVARKEIASHLENLTPEDFEKAFVDTYQPIVGHYFANYNNSAIKDRDPSVNNKTIEDAAFDAVLNAKELFGVSNKSEMALLAKAIFDKNDEQIIKLIKDWDDNYKNKELINPIRDDLEAANKSGGIHGLSPNNIKYIIDIITPGSTTITESIGSFRAFYEKEMLLESLWQKKEASFNPNKEARNFALYCLLSGMVGEKFKNACATYLRKLDKTPFSNEQYLAAADAYRKEHSGDAAFSKAISVFDANLSVYNNGKGIQGEEDTGGATGNNSATGQDSSQNQRQSDVNNISDQTDNDADSGGSIYGADGTNEDNNVPPKRKPIDIQNARNVNVNSPMRNFLNNVANRNRDRQLAADSVVTEPQATVTTSAVGEAKIPDRLYRQLIRRKIKFM